MTDSTESAAPAPEIEAEAILNFYRERCGGDGEALERMAYDFAVALADLAEAERRAAAVLSRMSDLTSFGFARCGIAGSASADRPTPAEPLLP